MSAAREIPISAARELEPAVRRTTWLRLALAAVALVLLAACVLAARDLRARPTTYFATGGGGIVVLDISTSIDVFRNQRITRTLRTIADTGGRAGLVLFSDTAYEALPPGTRGEELRPLLPFFPPGQLRRREAVRRRDSSPWSTTFRGGTRISTGLRQARLMIERDRIEAPSVLLVSDLDNSGFDTGSLTQEVIRYRREGIDLNVVPLFPTADDRLLFERLLGPSALLRRTELVLNSDVQERQTLVGDFPLALALAAAALLGLLAVNERLLGRLAWRTA